MKKVLIIMALTLVFALAFVSVIPAFAAEATYVCGDADGSGNVDIFDATKIQRVLAHLDTDPDGMIALRGDVTGDVLEISDVTYIQRYLAEYDDDLPIGAICELPAETQEPTKNYDLPVVRG